MGQKIYLVWEPGAGPTRHRGLVAVYGSARRALKAHGAEPGEGLTHMAYQLTKGGGHVTLPGGYAIERRYTK